MKLYAHNLLRFYSRLCTQEVKTSGEIEYCLMSAEQFPWDTQPMPEHASVFRRRFTEGGEVLTGSNGDEIVFTAWIQRGKIRIDELALQWIIPANDAVVYDVVTQAEWRGRGIYPEALRRLSGLLAEQGINQLWIYAEEENTASMRGIEKARFEYRGTLEARRIAGLVLRRGRVEGVNA
jgi:RimJ/RimL family protein N-acetyltransferase